MILESRSVVSLSTLSSSSMGHWYCSSQPSKKLLSLASCPTSTCLKPVLAATSPQVRDLPVPEGRREGGKEESGKENKIIASIVQGTTYVLQSHHIKQTSIKVVIGLKTSQVYGVIHSTHGLTWSACDENIGPTSTFYTGHVGTWCSNYTKQRSSTK